MIIEASKLAPIQRPLKKWMEHFTQIEFFKLQLMIFLIILNSLKTPINDWCANITPKLKNIRNTLRKQGGFFDIFFNLDDFLKFVSFGSNISKKTQHFYV